MNSGKPGSDYRRHRRHKEYPPFNRASLAKECVDDLVYRLSLLPTMAEMENRQFTPPAVELIDTECEFIIVADLPDFDKESIVLRFVGNNLLIKASAVQPGVESVDSAEKLEAAPVARLLRLPAGIDADESEAIYGDGVLTISLPKSKKLLGPAINTNKRVPLIFI